MSVSVQRPTIGAMRMLTAATLKGAIHVAVIMVTKVMVTTAQVSKLDIPYSRDYKYPSIIRTPQIQVPI